MVFSQKTVLTDKGDTLVCFSVQQSKFLLKQVYRVSELDTLLKICEKQRVICDTINERNAKILFNCMGVNDANERIQKVKDYQIGKLTEELNATKKEVRKQKVWKWVAKGTAIVVSGFFGYYVIKHP